MLKRSRKSSSENRRNWPLGMKRPASHRLTHRKTKATTPPTTKKRACDDTRVEKTSPKPMLLNHIPSVIRPTVRAKIEDRTTKPTRIAPRTTQPLVRWNSGNSVDGPLEPRREPPPPRSKGDHGRWVSSRSVSSDPDPFELTVSSSSGPSVDRAGPPLSSAPVASFDTSLD